MADTKYSTVDVTLNSFELPTFNVTSEPFGLNVFMGALAQLNLALDAVSLDIRLLTAGQGRLGEALALLTTALSSPRSQLKRFSGVPVAHSASSSSPKADVERQSPSDVRQLPLETHTVNHPCTCDLKSLMRLPGEHQAVVPLVLPTSDKSIGQSMDSSQSATSEKNRQTPSTIEPQSPTVKAAEAPKSPPPVAPDVKGTMDASLDRLRSTVIPDFSKEIDTLSSYAEKYPLAKGLAAIVVVLSAIGSKVVDEALSNVAKKILSWGASRLPGRLATTEGKDDLGVDQSEKRPAGKGTNIEHPDPKGVQSKRECLDPKDVQSKRGCLDPKDVQCKRECLDPKNVQGAQESKAKRPKPKKKGNPKDLSLLNIEVRRREPTPATAQIQSLVKPGGPAQGTSLFGKLTTFGSVAGKAAQPLRLLDAGIGIAQGVASGDTKAVVSSAGMLAGSYAGATAGAALGTLIFPGVGTAIGGLLGGFAGSELGSALGDKLGALVDRLGAPEQVSKELNGAQTQNQSVNFSPSIQVTCETADSSEQIRMVVAQQLQAQFHGEFVPLMGTNALATRRDVALTDGGL